MADAPYKGLTIRFGADTTEFTSRMNALNKVIGNTQTRLNQLTKAMRGDPSSIALLNEKFTVLRDQVTNAAVKVDSLRRGIEAMKALGIDKMAQGVKDTALNYQRADQAVKRVNQKLNQQYEAMRKIGEAVNVAFDKDDLETFYAKIEKSTTATEQQKRTVKALAEQVRILKNEHRSLDEQREKAKQIHEFKTMTTELEIAESNLRQFAEQVVATKERLASLKPNAVTLKALGAEFRELKEEGSSLDSQLRTLMGNLRKGGNSAESFQRAVDVAAGRIRNAAAQVDNLNEQLKMRQAQTGVQHVTESMTKLRSGIESAREKTIQAEQALASYKGKIDTAKQEWEGLHRQVRAIITRTTEMSDRTRAWLGITKEQEQHYRQLKAEIDGSAKKTKELEERARKAGKQLELAEALAAQKKLQTEFVESGARLTSLTTKAKAFGVAALNAARDFATGLGATVAPAVMMLGMHIVTAGDQIDSAFRDMKKTVDGTAEEFEHLRTAAVEFSRTHPVSADTILEVESLGGQLGITVDKLEDFAEVVSNLDIATNLNAETAATQLGQLNNILHWDAIAFDDGRSAMAHYGDALVRLGNNMPTQEDRISTITMAIASTGQVMGMTTPEILGWATAIASTGQGAESSGTAISNTMIDIEAAVGQGGDALAAFAEVAQMSAEDFAHEWKTAPSEAMFKFVSGLKSLSDSGESATRKLDELEIRGVRQVRALLSLGETIDIVKKAQDMASDAWRNGGDAAREAAQKSEGFSGKLKMLKNTAQTMGDAFASKLLPLMDKLLALFQMLARAIDDMDEGTAEMITVMGGIAIALGPVMRMVSQTAITFGAFKTAAIEASIASQAMGKAIAAPGTSQALLDAQKNTSLLSRALSAVTNPANSAKAALVTFAVAGVALLATAIANYVKEQERFAKATDKMKDSLYQTADAAGRNASAFDEGGSAYRRCLDDINKLVDEHGRLHDEMAKSTKDTKTRTTMMERYADAIKSNNGVSVESRVEAERLRQAVEKLNEEYGISLQLVEEDGKLHVLAADGTALETEKLNGLIEAKRREIELTAISNMQAELVAQQIKDQDALREAKKQTAIAQEEYNKALESGDEFVQEYYQQLQAAQKDEEKAQKLLDGTTESLTALDAKYRRASEAVDDHGIRVKELADEFPLLAEQLDQVSDRDFGLFIDALDESGYSTEALGKLTQDEMEKMVETWASGSASWRHDMDVATDRLNQDARKVNDGLQANFEQMKNETISKISEMTGVSESTLRKLADDAGVDSELAMRKWVEGIAAAEMDSRNAAGRNEKAVEEELAKAIGAAQTTGENIGYGLQRGISSTIDAIALAARNVVATAIAAANDEGVIESPSKKTMWTGKMLGEGYVVGMEKEEDAVRKQGAILASLAIGAGYAGSGTSLGSMSRMAASLGGSVGNTTNNSTSNEYVNITLNVEARDLQDVRTIDDIVEMARRARAQYA